MTAFWTHWGLNLRSWQISAWEKKLNLIPLGHLRALNRFALSREQSPSLVDTHPSPHISVLPQSFLRIPTPQDLVYNIPVLEIYDRPHRSKEDPVSSFTSLS